MSRDVAGDSVERFIGVMSGTSQDGIDVVLAEFDHGRFDRILAVYTGHYDPALRAELVDLSRETTPVSLARYAALDRAVADAFADAIIALVESAAVDISQVRAVGSHGQTVFHDATTIANSLQLGDPSRIAARTGMTVVGDFRRADVARGGQGAPLLPVLHHALFARPDEPRAVLNLGGIANLTLLPDGAAENVRGFDCGPASCLMDEWIEQHRGERFDRDGSWAATGTLDEELLGVLLAEPYFAAPIPKSTGRGQFHLGWVQQRAPGLAQRVPADVQRTLCELTARSVADALLQHGPQMRRLIVCGGGVHNRFLMSRIAARLDGIAVESSGQHGLDPQWVEATAFAWLACRRLREEPGNLPAVTGACAPAVLGGVYR